jgi:hypothetical protein
MQQQGLLTHRPDIRELLNRQQLPQRRTLLRLPRTAERLWAMSTVSNPPIVGWPSTSPSWAVSRECTAARRGGRRRSVQC